jgi:multiple sugar transport system substrate-binding protein
MIKSDQFISEELGEDNMFETKETKQIGRRDFLKLASLVSGGAILAACAPAATAVAPAAPTTAAAAPTAVPAAKEPVLIRTTSQMGVDIVNGFAGSLTESLAAKNIKLEIFETSMDNWAQYADKIITQIAGGEQLDVLMIAIEGVALLGIKNILVDLASYLATDPVTDKMVKEDIAPALTDMLRYKGKLLEIPFSWNNMILYYNTKIMADDGVTVPMNMSWDDFLQIGQKVSKVTGSAADRYAYSFWGTGFFGMCAWLYQNDGQGVLNDDWTASNLDNPKVAETVQYLADLILKHKYAPNPAGWDEQGQFVAGNLVMRTCGRWCINGLQKNNFTDYDIVYNPHKSGNIVTVGGTDGWGISSKTKTPNEAYTVAAALSGPGPSLEMVKLGGNIPALRSIANTPEFSTYGPKNTKIFYESLEKGCKALPAPTNFNIIEPLVDRNLAPIWNGEVSVEEGLKKAHAELTVEMDKIKGQ